ncbi:hypothetical protein ACSZMR_12905 [Aeromonas veronii]
MDHDAMIACNLCTSEELDETVVLVISQDCDLTQAPSQEPLIEVITGQILDRADGNNTNAKNARKLHIEIDRTGSQLWAEFIATSKSSVKKEDLIAFYPRKDVRLAPENLMTLQRWLASRYRRSAFPDQFEQRLKDAKLNTKISKLAKRLGTHLSGVFFDVDEGQEVDRNGADDTYLLDITILYTTEPDPVEAKRDADEMVDEIEKAFKDSLFKPYQKWQNIELRFCEAISEAALTYETFRQLKKWNLDHLSLAEVPQLPMVE